MFGNVIISYLSLADFCINTACVIKFSEIDLHEMLRLSSDDL